MSRNLTGCILDLLFNQHIENVIKAVFSFLKLRQSKDCGQQIKCCRLRSLLFLGLIISTLYFGVSLIALFKYHSL